MKLLVDPDGGDLGRAEEVTEIAKIPSVVMRVAQVLSAVRDLKPKDRILAYPIEVKTVYKRVVEEMLLALTIEGLPEGCAFYECDGLRVFEIRGPSGGIVTSLVFYLVCK